jgi:hypothetical protein
VVELTEKKTFLQADLMVKRVKREEIMPLSHQFGGSSMPACR